MQEQISADYVVMRNASFDLRHLRKDKFSENDAKLFEFSTLYSMRNLMYLNFERLIIMKFLILI